MGKDKTTKQTTEVKVDEELKRMGDEQYVRGLLTSMLKPEPNRAPTIASMTPQQVAAMNAQIEGANSFGFDFDPVTMPKPTTSETGFSGYSTGGLFDDAVAGISPERKAQVDDIDTALERELSRVDPARAPAEAAETVTQKGKSDPLDYMAWRQSNNDAGDYLGYQMYLRRMGAS